MKTLYKTTNKEIRCCYNAYRINTIQRHLDQSRSAKKAHKELNKSKLWIPSLQPGSTNCKSRVEIINIATDFYKNLYSQPDPLKQKSDINQFRNRIQVEEFTESDIFKQIMKLKPEKSPGPDKITNECIKSARTLLLTPITLLFNKILHEEVVPRIWTVSEIILLYKKVTQQI